MQAPRIPGALMLLTVCLACMQPVHGPRLHVPDQAPARADAHGGVLKVHLHSGDLVVLSSWAARDGLLEGRGRRYSPQRAPQQEGFFSLPNDSIALLETETRVGSRSTGVAGMAVWSVLWGGITLACVSDPKGCFGSCPTFYVATDSGEALAAEGFSASIARALEARDLDALYHARAAPGPFTVRMRNEAWETHAVRGLLLHAVPRPRAARVLATGDGRFYGAADITGPVRCGGENGSCLHEIASPDGIERTSAADSTDLQTRESIVLRFAPRTGQLGLILGARQSLMSTYLFYETMGFLGSHVGHALAQLERDGPGAARAMGMARLIGPIDVDVWSDGAWQAIGVHDEAGPLATQFVVLPFTHTAHDSIDVRLTLAKGAWRLDWIALADLTKPLEAITIPPERVTRLGAPDPEALATLTDRERHLITYPGDEYDIVFRLPTTAEEWDVFLESEGYYYEWMRAEWLADENLAMARLALDEPAAALRVLAPGFKRVEADMERVFWSSRFRR